MFDLKRSIGGYVLSITITWWVPITKHTHQIWHYKLTVFYHFRPTQIGKKLDLQHITCCQTRCSQIMLYFNYVVWCSRKKNSKRRKQWSDGFRTSLWSVAIYYLGLLLKSVNRKRSFGDLCDFKVDNGVLTITCTRHTLFKRQLHLLRNIFQITTSLTNKLIY